MQIAGYTTHIPAGPARNTIMVAAALTPYGLVWSSYRSALLRAGEDVMPHPYRVHLSPGDGHGSLERSGRLIARIPQTYAGKSVDLSFIGATGPYLAFALSPASNQATLAAGVVNLVSGRVSMLRPLDARGAEVVAAGGRIGLIQKAKVVFYNPATGRYRALPAIDGQTLGNDLAYGLPPGSHAAPGRALQGVVAYPLRYGVVIYAPPGWKLSETDTGGDWVLWQVTDPADPHSYVQETTSACWGCSSIGYGLVPGALDSPGPAKPPVTGLRYATSPKPRAMARNANMAANADMLISLWNQQLSAVIATGGALDTKATALVGAAALLLVLSLETPMVWNSWGVISTVGLIGSILAGLISMQGSLPRVGPEISDFFSAYGTMPPHRSRLQLLSDLASSVGHNNRALAIKRRWVATAICLLTLGSIAQVCVHLALPVPAAVVHSSHGR